MLITLQGHDFVLVNWLTLFNSCSDSQIFYPTGERIIPISIPVNESDAAIELHTLATEIKIRKYSN